jgi:hypothetical protein
MDLQLKDKVVIVTGGAKGTGAAIVRLGAAEGAIPVIVDRDGAAGEKLQRNSRLLVSLAASSRLSWCPASDGNGERVPSLTLSFTQEVSGVNVLPFGGQLVKRAKLSILFPVGLTIAVIAQSRSKLPTQTSDLEMRAIVNLRKLEMAESTYAMSHSQEGFACDPQVLTKLEWPDSRNHAKFLDPALLGGMGQYKLSAQCVGNSKPVGKLNILAVPLDPNAHLRTFCASGTFGPFETKPYFATGGFSIRSVSGGAPESCLVSGEPLK